jgi:hypothetical protein
MVTFELREQQKYQNRYYEKNRRNKRNKIKKNEKEKREKVLIKN